MQAASMDFRAYALDMWGFGGSGKDPNRYLLSHQRDLLDKFLYELGIGKIAIIGHGLGAIVGLLYAIEFPRFVDRVMAIGLPLETNLINPRLLQSPPNELADWLLGTTPEAEAARIEAPKADQDAILRTINNLSSIELTKIPERLNNPCLIVHGMNDPAVGVGDKEKLEKLPENFHFIHFNQSGHFPMLDQPNYFNRLMVDFLALNSGERPRQHQLKQEWKRRLR